MCELLDNILALKELGNEQQNRGELNLALETYQQTLAQIKQLPKSKLDETKCKKLNELKADCYYNLALCYLKQQKALFFQSNILKSFILNTILENLEKRINDVVLLFNVLLRDQDAKKLNKYFSELNLTGISDTYFTQHRAFIAASEGNLQQACQHYTKKIRSGEEGEVSDQEPVGTVFDHIYQSNTF